MSADQSSSSAAAHQEVRSTCSATLPAASHSPHSPEVPISRRLQLRSRYEHRLMLLRQSLHCCHQLQHHEADHVLLQFLRRCHESRPPQRPADSGSDTPHGGLHVFSLCFVHDTAHAPHDSAVRRAAHRLTCPERPGRGWLSTVVPRPVPLASWLLTPESARRCATSEDCCGCKSYWTSHASGVSGDDILHVHADETNRHTWETGSKSFTASAHSAAAATRRLGCSASFTSVAGHAGMRLTASPEPRPQQHSCGSRIAPQVHLATMQHE